MKKIQEKINTKNMNERMQKAVKAYKNVVPFVLALRLITLTTAPSLAVAATKLPAVDGPITVGVALPDLSVTPIQVTDFLAETNAARAAVGLQPLVLNDQLVAAAQSKANDMVANGYWDHFRPADHKAPWDFIKEAGYTYHFAGENLARGFKTAHGITEAWLQSPTHRANLLSENYTEVGFATRLILNDQGEQVILTVQMFGSK